MQIQKIFSDVYDDERLYSVLMSEEEVALYSDLMEYLYSDAAEDALAGAGAAGLGLAAAGAGAYGAKKGLEHFIDKKEAVRKAKRKAAVEEAVGKAKDVKKARKEVEKLKKAYRKASTSGGNEKAAELWEQLLNRKDAKGELERLARKEAEKKIKLGKAAGAERVARKANVLAEKVLKTLKNNKKTAAGVGAGLVATGAGINALRHKNND